MTRKLQMHQKRGSNFFPPETKVPMPGAPVLAIETSCDETAVALATEDGEIILSKVASQIELHAPYGGVVPELASRNHSVDLRPLIDQTLREASINLSSVGSVAATSGPGLSSSLLIGDATAKAIAVGLECPFYSINHMEGHLLSPFIGRDEKVSDHVALIVSGGHTMLVDVTEVGEYQLMGSTRDDAAGEAFDKVGKMLGLEYPGGPIIGRRAQTGNRKAFEFPRSMIDSGDFQFSFSGLKTSARYALDKLGDEIEDTVIDDFCASFEEAIVDVLIKKLFRAAEVAGRNLITISGGVSCNHRLRERAVAEAEKRGIRILLAMPEYSTDNAGMIAFAAALRRQAGIAPSGLDSDIDPNMKLA